MRELFNYKDEITLAEKYFSGIYVIKPGNNIEVIRRKFIEGVRVKNHIHSKKLNEFGKYYEETLFDLTELLFDVYKAHQKKVEENFKISFFDEVYTYHIYSLRKEILLIIYSYDRIKNKKNHKKLFEDIYKNSMVNSYWFIYNQLKICSLMFADIRMIKEYEKKIESTSKLFSGNPAEKRKRKTKLYKKHYVGLSESIKRMKLTVEARKKFSDNKLMEIINDEKNGLINETIPPLKSKQSYYQLNTSPLYKELKKELNLDDYELYITILNKYISPRDIRE